MDREVRWTGRSGGPGAPALESWGAAGARGSSQRCPGPSGQGGGSALLWYERVRAGQAGTFRWVGGPCSPVGLCN